MSEDQAPQEEESYADATLPGADEGLLVQTEFPEEDEFPDPPQEARDLGVNDDGDDDDWQAVD